MSTEVEKKHQHQHHQNQDARLGDPEISGDKWWPNEGDRVVQLIESGATMASGERAAAERELAARERRKKSPVVIKRESIRFEPSSYKGIHIGYIVAPHLGIENRNISLEVHRLLPGAHTESHRHNEVVCHVLNGRGYSIIDGKRYDWEPHDSIHIQKGAWHQHFNASDKTPAHILAGKPTPVLEFFSPHAMVYKGDSFSDVPDDFMPEHPFTHERVSVGYVGGQKWMSHLQLATHERLAQQEQRRREARVLLKASEAVIERSEHKGDWKVGLIDEYLGFDNRILALYIHQMPPNSYTETHKHGEAIVYVLSGRGYSIVEGERYDWKAGDCIFVQPAIWHQHFNSDPEHVSQHMAIYIAPMRDRIVRGAEFVDWKTEPDYRPSVDNLPAGEWWK
jgi:quercetin dioxygenase-like cupin family protein